MISSRLSPAFVLGFALLLCSCSGPPAAIRGGLAGEARWQSVVEGLQRPTDVQVDPQGRLYVLERDGRILRVAGDEIDPRPFLDIRDRVTAQAGEQGLLGLAFHPDYGQNGTFFINYTGRGGDSFISRFQVMGDPDRADADSERILLHIEQPYGNHNGGGMVFGPDGYLYISTGDGGSAGDPQGNAQSLETLLGKLLRIDVDAGAFYAVPSDNPFVDADGARPEIWAYGLRNPWRFAFDPANGDLYIADVGQNSWEEVNFEAAGSAGGRNYGWNYREGAHPFEGEPGELELVEPIAEYSHDDGCSITGGVVVREERLSEWDGVYLYGDACSGRIWGVGQESDGTWRSQLLFETRFNVSSFGQGGGEIYLLDYDDEEGALYRLRRDR